MKRTGPLDKEKVMLTNEEINDTLANKVNKPITRKSRKGKKVLVSMGNNSSLDLPDIKLLSKCRKRYFSCKGITEY